MPFLNDRIHDLGLNILTTEGETLTICNALPGTFTEAKTTFALGEKTGPTISVPTDGTPDGRKVDISQITDGVVNTSGSATHWAIVDETNSRLLAAHTLTNGPLVVTTGSGPFTLTAFEIRSPDPV